ncbi:hydroxymethylglutaryl-CoA lyase [Blastococcus sp. Marseille-P5729]|uniref:hydroxymethylglutaryl-CoA lyase n=1 Tax=Blastococcus sp. Marseille-P5729 TaxID=2086582 RepID=UPI000D0EABFF|nr:hydroxymethylglutaryl-CoA lyase [Blastococcus sp. Marseille-P5729]
MSHELSIVEVAPRDGLQNEKTLLTTAAKVSLIEQLVEAGVRRIEAASFVHPKLVPAMADSEAVMEAVPRRGDVSYIGLVLNSRGGARAQAAGVDEVNVVASASEGFAQRNQNSSVEAIISEAEQVIADVKQAGMPVSITITTVFGCPFDGEVDPDVTVGLAARAARAGVDEIALGDTIGVAVPTQVSSLFNAIRAEVGDGVRLRGHFHNTRNTGYANAYAALEAGVRVLDASAGGIGGCPFAPAATGNIATEDLLYLVHRMGYRTGVDLEKITPISAFLAGELHHDTPALLGKAGGFPTPDGAR